MRKPSFCGFMLITLISVILRPDVVDGSLFDDVIDKGASTKKRELTPTNFSAGPSLTSQIEDYDDELLAFLQEQSFNAPRDISSGGDARDENQLNINLNNARESYLGGQNDETKAIHHKLTEYSMAAPLNEEELNKFVRESYGSQSSPIQVPTSYTQFQGPIAVHFNTYNDELAGKEESLFASPPGYGNSQDSPQQNPNRRPSYYDRQPRDGSHGGSLFSPAQFDSVGPPAPPPVGAFDIGPPAPPVPVRPPLPVAPVRPPAPPPAPLPPAPPTPTRPPRPVGPSPGAGSTSGKRKKAKGKKAQGSSHPSIYTHVNLHINNEIAPEYGGYEEEEEQVQQDIPSYDQVEVNDPPPVYEPPRQDPPQINNPVNGLPQYQRPFQADFSDAQATPPSGYQVSSFDSAAFNPSTGYSPPVQANPQNNYQGPFQSPIQSNPGSGYQPPTQSNPVNNFQVTPQANPSNGYEAPGQANPITGYQASAQANPTNGYRAPAQSPIQANPSTEYQASAQANPSTGNQAPVQFDPTSFYQTPSLNDPAPVQANPTSSYGAPPQLNPSRPSYNAPSNDPPQNTPRVIQSNPSFVLASPVLLNANSFQNPGTSYSFSASDAQQDASAVHYHVHVADAQGLQDVQQLFDDSNYDAPRNPPLANPIQGRRPRGYKYRSRRIRGQRQSDPRLRNPLQRNTSGVTEILKLKCLLWCGFKQYEF